MSQKSINNLSLNSLTLNNTEYQGQTAFVYFENVLTTNNSGVLLSNGIPISAGGSSVSLNEGVGITIDEGPTDTFLITNNGVLELTAGDNITISGTNSNLTINSTAAGAVDTIIPSNGISVSESTPGNFEIENTGVLSLIAGTGIDIDFGTGDITVTNTIDTADFQTKNEMADYSTTTESNALYQSKSEMADYSTTTESNALYQPKSEMASYSTTIESNALYQPIGGVASLTAGTGISLTGTNDNLTINNTNIFPYASAIFTTQITALPNDTDIIISFTIPNFEGDTTSTYIISNNSTGSGLKLILAVSNVFTINPNETDINVSFYNNSGASVTSSVDFSVLVINN